MVTVEATLRTTRERILLPTFELHLSLERCNFHHLSRSKLALGLPSGPGIENIAITEFYRSLLTISSATVHLFLTLFPSFRWHPLLFAVQ